MVPRGAHPLSTSNTPPTSHPGPHLPFGPACPRPGLAPDPTRARERGPGADPAAQPTWWRHRGSEAQPSGRDLPPQGSGRWTTTTSQYGRHDRARAVMKQQLEQRNAREQDVMRSIDARMHASRYRARGLGSTEAGEYLESDYRGMEPKAHCDRAAAAASISATADPFPWLPDKPESRQKRWNVISTQANRPTYVNGPVQHDPTVRGGRRKFQRQPPNLSIRQDLPPIQRHEHRGKKVEWKGESTVFSATPPEKGFSRERSAFEKEISKRRQLSHVLDNSHNVTEKDSAYYLDRRKPPKKLEIAHKKLSSTVFDEKAEQEHNVIPKPTLRMFSDRRRASSVYFGDPAPPGDSMSIQAHVVRGKRGGASDVRSTSQVQSLMAHDLKPLPLPKNRWMGRAPAARSHLTGSGVDYH